MNEKIKKHLIKYNESKKWETADANLVETVIESNSIWEGQRDKHRWYTLIPTVVCIGGMFLKYSHCDVNGEESSVEDCIGGYKLEDIIEVQPKTVETTVYEELRE